MLAGVAEELITLLQLSKVYTAPKPGRLALGLCELLVDGLGKEVLSLRL